MRARHNPLRGGFHGSMLEHPCEFTMEETGGEPSLWLLVVVVLVVSSSTISSEKRWCSFMLAAPRMVRNERAVRPCLPMTLPMSWGATRTCRMVESWSSISSTETPSGMIDQCLDDLQDEMFHLLSRLAVCCGSNFVHHRHLLGVCCASLIQSHCLNLG